MTPSLSLGELVREPVRVEPWRPPLSPARAELAVAAVIPCFNRQRDLAALLGDLSKLDFSMIEGGEGRVGVRLSVLVVDNASVPSLASLGGTPDLEVEFLRLAANAGGSGGFNAGLARLLRHAAADPAGNGAPRYLWLLDSDARVRPDTLGHLVNALERDPRLAAAGSAIADPATGLAFELGGSVDRRTGRFDPVHRGVAGVRGPVVCDYVAACSALVRREAVERAGLMPDVFLNGDDVEWFLRLARVTGQRVAAVPESISLHPTFDRFPTTARYYIARNGFGPIDELGLGPLARFRRALREVARAVGQTMMGRRDLAEFHLRGLADAARRRLLGPASGGGTGGALEFEPFHPMGSLAERLVPHLPARPGPLRVAVHRDLGVSEADRSELDRQLRTAGAAYTGLDRVSPAGFARRLLRRSRPDLALVPARGRPSAWLAGRTVIAVSQHGFVIRRSHPLRAIGRSALVAARGLALATRLALRRRRPSLASASSMPADETPALPTLAVVVLSHNRWPALSATLTHLLGPVGLGAESIVVIDNASTDGSPAMVSRDFPGIRAWSCADNHGVDAFNRAVDRLLSEGGEHGPEVVLILDDDARPEPAALRSALALLARRPEVGAVTLHPCHPATGRTEWPFARAAGADDRWPVMGCANLVRTWAWRRVGGYEADYFLYRNDTDLALKLLAAGIPVHFNPDWVVHHDSPSAERKSARWHRLATRNWIWTARRHSGGPRRWLAIVLGWGWAHRLAGFSLRRHEATLRGAVDGLRRRPPRLPTGVRSEGEHLGRLLRYQLRLRRVR